MFRKILKGCNLVMPLPSFSLVQEVTSFLQDGSVVSRSVIRSQENSEVELPSPDLFTLGSLLASGVKLENVNPCLLNPSDLVTIEGNNIKVVQSFVDSVHVENVDSNID